MFKRLKAMFGLSKSSAEKPDAITVQLSNATQRNEMAGERLRELLLSDRNARMGAIVNDIVGKMQ